MKLKPVICEWYDAYAENESKHITEIKHSKGYLTYTIGWLIKKDGYGISIAVDLYPEELKECHTVVFIPNGMLKTIHVLEVPAKLLPAPAKSKLTSKPE